MTVCPSRAPAPDLVQVSLRECRVVAERLLNLLGAPRGAVRTMATDIVCAAACDRYALTELLEILESGIVAPHRYRVERRDGVTLVDLDRTPWSLAITYVRSVLTDARHRSSRPDVRVSNGSGRLYQEPLASFAADLGFRCTAETTREPELAFTQGLSGPELPDAHPPALAALISDGLTMSKDDWLALFRESSKALSVETVVSRRHAGATMVDEAGNIHGEIPDGFDLSVYVDVDITVHDQTKIGMKSNGHR